MKYFLKKNKILKNIKNLNSFLESLFFTQLVLNEEPLMLLGETSYKTYLAKLILFNKSNIINLNPKTKLNQLFPSTSFIAAPISLK